MNRAISIVIVLLLLIVFVPISLASNFTDETTAEAASAPLVRCESVSTNPIRVVCKSAGVVVFDAQIKTQVLNLPTVTLPPIQIPGPTQTVTGEPQTETVTMPGQVVTETIKPTSGPTLIVGPTQTVTQPGETTTVTASPDPGQVGTTPATMNPDADEDSVITIPTVDLDGKDIVILSTLGVLGVVGLLLLGMYISYYIGYKDSDKKEVTFLKSLLGKN